MKLMKLARPDIYQIYHVYQIYQIYQIALNVHTSLKTKLSAFAAAFGLEATGGRDTT